MATDEDINTMNERTAAWMRFHFDRVKAERETNGFDFTQEDLADLLSESLRKNVSREAVNRMLQGKQKFEYPVVVKMAQIFGTELPINLPVATKQTVAKIFVLRNSVAVGVWREEDKVMIAPERISVDIVPKPAYEALEHTARYVEDGHADLFVPKDFYVLTVPYHEAKKSLNHGDDVVIERVRRDLSNTGEALRELSIRRLIKNGDKWILQSLCSVPGIVPDHEYTGDTEELRIVELIVHRFA